MCVFMAKEIGNTTIINNPEDLITSREEIRAGFIAIALEKNYLAIPFVEEAKALRVLASTIKRPKDLLGITDLRMGLLTASGLSDKALNHLTDEDKTFAIAGLIEKFLEPAGDNFVDELVYRYLLTRGDTLGGKARNLAGSLGEWKFLRSLLSVLNITGIHYHWLDSESNSWLLKPDDDAGIEKRIKGLYWKKNNMDRLLVMNTNVPRVKKNVDILLFNGTPDELIKGKNSITYTNEKYIALGELKGGLDPAGADEHWKTANTALDRIRKGFKKNRLTPKVFFIGAAIENSMASEIFKQLKNNSLNNAANLTKDLQLTSICNWIANI